MVDLTIIVATKGAEIRFWEPFRRLTLHDPRWLAWSVFLYLTYFKVLVTIDFGGMLIRTGAQWNNRANRKTRFINNYYKNKIMTVNTSQVDGLG